MPDKARRGMTAALCVLLTSGPAVAHAAPAVHQPALAQEQIRDLPQGLWGLLGLLGLFGLLGLTRRGPRRNAKNPLAGHSGDDELARQQGRHHAPEPTGSPTNPAPERPPAVAGAQVPRPDGARMPDPRRPVTKTPADVPMPSSASVDGPSGARPMPRTVSEPPSGDKSTPQVGSPMDTVPTAPTPAQHRTPEPFPQTDQDPAPPQPAVPQQQGPATGTFADLPRYPETDMPDPGPVDAAPRHRR